MVRIFDILFRIIRKLSFSLLSSFFLVIILLSLPLLLLLLLIDFYLLAHGLRLRPMFAKLTFKSSTYGNNTYVHLVDSHRLPS